jgi:outer membrane biosynthesis protein TonB
MKSRVQKTLATLLLSAASLLLTSTMTSCASLHKTTASAPPPPAAPELSQTPLYSPEMSENTPKVPDLPATSQTAVVQPPPPPPPKPKRVKKPKTTTPKEGTTPDTSTTAAATQPPAGPAAAPAAAAPAPAAEKKPVTEQASIADATPAAASPIGDLTTGSAGDSAEATHQAADLIKSTRDGLQGIKRPLSSDEKKTAAEIQTFLTRAQAALKNGDVDGATGLATKAKLLLDELTQK